MAESSKDAVLTDARNPKKKPWVTLHYPRLFELVGLYYVQMLAKQRVGVQQNQRDNESVNGD